MSTDSLFEQEVLLTKDGKPRKRKPKSKNEYFTSETEDAVVEYILETDDNKRNRIYQSKLHYAFYKLVENIIHSFKFYYTDVDKIEDLKYELISHILQKIHLYDRSRGKAFSYFGTAVKRYLIDYNKKNYKRLTSQQQIVIGENSFEDDNLIFEDPNQEELNEYEIVENFISTLEIEIFDLFKDDDLRVAIAVLDIFKKRHNLEIFNKKALFIYVKEMVDVKTLTITKVVKVMKNRYYQLLNEKLEKLDL